MLPGRPGTRASWEQLAVKYFIPQQTRVSQHRWHTDAMLAVSLHCSYLASHVLDLIWSYHWSNCKHEAVGGNNVHHLLSKPCYKRKCIWPRYTYTDRQAHRTPPSTTALVSLLLFYAWSLYLRKEYLYFFRKMLKIKIDHISFDMKGRSVFLSVPVFINDILKYRHLYSYTELLLL